MDAISALILDDALEITFLLRAALEAKSFKVTTCSNALDGLATLTKDKYDLIITDFVMEGMNGLEFIKEVRGRLKMLETKIILLTFRDLDAAEREILGKENVQLMKKPFLQSEMIKTLQALFAAK